VSVLSVAANPQRDKEFSGKVSALDKSVVEIKNKYNKSERFKIDPQLMSKARLEEGNDVTVFYSLIEGQKKVTGVQIGKKMWHQKDCSPDDCRCTSYNCEPKCHCRT